MTPRSINFPSALLKHPKCDHTSDLVLFDGWKISGVLSPPSTMLSDHLNKPTLHATPVHLHLGDCRLHFITLQVTVLLFCVSRLKYLQTKDVLSSPTVSSLSFWMNVSFPIWFSANSTWMLPLCLTHRILCQKPQKYRDTQYLYITV